MSLSATDIIGEPPDRKVYTKEELTRRLRLLEEIVNVLLERMAMVDKNQLMMEIMPEGQKVVSVPDFSR